MAEGAFYKGDEVPTQKGPVFLHRYGRGGFHWSSSDALFSCRRFNMLLSTFRSASSRTAVDGEMLLSASSPFSCKMINRVAAISPASDLFTTCMVTASNFVTLFRRPCWFMITRCRNVLAS